MRLRFVFVAVVLGASLAGPVRADAAAPGVLAVRAETSGFVAVTFHSSVQLDTTHWSLSGKGNYRVAVLDRVVDDRADEGWNLLLADVPAASAHVALGAVGDGKDETVVPPGDYRVYVVSDAPAVL